MQHALLGLAIAFILAVAAALAAPAYVNWSDWRANFESHATALAGSPVRIRGGIEATLLPTPAFTFRDVDIGEPEKGTGARIGEVRGVLSLGALLRGTVEAEEFVLVRPAIQIAADAANRPVLQSVRGAAAATGLVALARISIERGSLVVGRGGDSLILDDIYAEGEMRSHQGPMRIDGVFRKDGRRWGVRANTGQFSGDGSGRVRVTLEHAGAGRTFDADGMLSLASAAPRFEGKVSAAHRGPAGTPWQVAANAKAGEAAVALDSIALSLGKDAAPTELAGKVEFEPWRGGRIDGALTARRIDLDAVAGGEAARGLPAAFAPLRELFALLDAMPLQGRLGLAAEAVVAAGGTMRDVRAELGLRQDALALERFEATLPGRGSLIASGGGTSGARFSGRAAVEAEDTGAFLRWAFGGKAASLQDAGALRLAGKVDWRDERVQVEGLEFALGEAKLGGGVSFEPGAGTKRARVAAELTANEIDLDLLKPVAEWARAESGGADLSLGLQGRALRVLGRPLARIDVAVSRTAEAVAIERLAVENFDGLSVRAKGRIAAPIERPSGTIDFDIATARPDGLAAIAQEFLGEEPARLVRHVAGSGSALKLSGKATGAGSAAGVEVNAAGTLGDLDATVAANFDLLTERLSEAQITLEAREPGSLAVLFGLSPGLPSAGSGVLEIDVSKPEDGALPMHVRLSVPGAEITAEGALRSGEGGRIEPRFAVKVAAGDLRPLLASAAQAGGDRAVAAEGGWRFARNRDGFLFDDIALVLGDTSVRGALTMSALVKPVLGGKLAVGRMDLAALLGLAVGRARDGSAVWPAARIGPAMLADATGAVELEVGELGLSGRLATTKSRFRLRLGAGNAAIEDFTGEFAGGTLAGHANFVRGERLAFDGRASLEGFDVARLVAPDERRPEVRGRGRMTLSLAGSGATPAAIAASLAGQGTLALEGFEIDRADPEAVGSVFAADETSEPRDEISVIAALSPALARAPLKIGKIEAPIVVAGGNARTVKARTAVGATQVALEASLDIAKLTFDAALELEIEPAGGLAVRPGAIVRWRGPLGAPERGIEAAALANAINLRAMERETKRIEERDRALPPRTQPTPGPETNPVASIPPAVPAPVQVPLPQSRPRAADQPRVALPPLPPPAEIRPLPPVYRPDSN